MTTILRLTCTALFVAITSTANADVQLAGLFVDNAVLQRDQPIPIWGTATANEEVSIALAGQTAKTKAREDGRWKVIMPKLEAGGPHSLVVECKNRVEIKNLLVGEVWLCSGQSNMAWTVSRAKNPQSEIAAADFPKIRMFTVPRGGASEARTDVKGDWQVCSPKTVGRFSATAYYFGRKLHQELNVPVGLINSSVGGTPIEFWTSRAAQEKMFADKKVKVIKPSVTTAGKNAGQLYNAMIAPLAPYAIRGAIWYQGERNTKQGDSRLYRFQLPAMIGNWREIWGQGDFPFLWVQLPNFMGQQTKPTETSGWVLVREGMLKSLSTNNTGMAVTVDVGEARDIHPKNKQDVGLRLALWALAKSYGKELVHRGPLVKSQKIEGGKFVIEFDAAGSQLATAGDQPLKSFALAGEDKNFVWAQAKIDGNTVVVSSPQITKPVAVRYSWAANPIGNLTNKEGLPASPFRTDNWDE
jgi:sialate O-acetylesterase